MKSDVKTDTIANLFDKAERFPIWVKNVKGTGLLYRVVGTTRDGKTAFVSQTCDKATKPRNNDFKTIPADEPFYTLAGDSKFLELTHGQVWRHIPDSQFEKAGPPIFVVSPSGALAAIRKDYRDDLFGVYLDTGSMFTADMGRVVENCRNGEWVKMADSLEEYLIRHVDLRT